ncbi:ABC transporter ATP-binding protein [Clostridium sp. JN-9]|uniref:ABC transporter ATP-binding protein n=1 Tax=Clostridium sp. JN-9 TaxID=2507159 RepID=UPI001FAADD34|nr:ABC transporter ATP-binding protein [Clostridium sp. JN-9]
MIKDLCKSFYINNEEIKAVRNVNLSIKNESFTTIVGKSGCGKTTLLRMICGLETQTSGEINFLNEKGVGKVGIVFQEPRLMPWLTVKQNMAFPITKDRNKNNIDETVNKYLNMLGLEKFKDAYPSQISGGMAQRVSLGRTLCYNPDIILMDEPLGALDAFNRRKLQNEFINIFKKYKKTIVFVTHDVEEAIYLGENVVIMDQGTVVEQVPVNMDYLRDTASIDFIKLRKHILNRILLKN